MKKLHRLVLGLLSTAFLAVGFTKAADKLDPLGNSIETSKRVAPTPDSVSNCDFADEG